MQLSTTTKNLTTITTDCLILGINQTLTLPAETQALDKTIRQQLQETIRAGDFTGTVGETWLLTHVTGLAAKRVLLVGTGEDKQRSAYQYRKLLTSAYQAVLKTKSKQVVTTLHQLSCQKEDCQWQLSTNVLNLFEQLYQFDQYKSKKNEAPTLKKLTFMVDKEQTGTAKKTIQQAAHIATGMNFTKDLGNTPPNICNPAYLAKQARNLAKQHDSLTTTVIDQKEAEKLGMGAFVSVAKGSNSPGKIIIMQYKGAKKSDKPVVLVGKGLTYDTGGYCLKPAVPMFDMKYDMCGAATVFGVMKATAELNLPINIVGVVAAAENMVSGEAARPADIVKTLSGQTVEITNTDAEGRLALCDALTYIGQYKPRQVISVATLTGAAIISLGYENTAILSNQQTFADSLLKASQTIEDQAWQLPLQEAYQEYLKSEFADLLNAPFTRAAGTITAATFLSNFTKDYEWAHLDIAGSSLIPGKQAQASGRPVPLLMTYLIEQTQS